MLFVNAEFKLKNIAKTELYMNLKYNNTVVVHQYSFLQVQGLSQSEFILDNCAEALFHAVISACVPECRHTLWRESGLL